MRNLLKRFNGVMLIFSLSLLVMLTTSCRDAKLKVAIESANKQCPVKMGEFGKITSIVYDGRNVIYTFNVDEIYTNIKALKEQPENLKSSMAIMFQNPNKEVKTLLDLIVKCNAGLQMVYVGKNSGDKVECELTAGELNEAINANINSSKSDLIKLETQIKMANLQFPLKASEEITIEKMELSNEAVIYLCSVDEKACNIDLIEENHETVKQGIVDELSNKTDQPTQLFIKYCTDCNRNIVYRYIGNQSGTQYDVVVTVPELKELLKNK
ncbi:hypothetical protein [Bacteroides sp.]|uniref:hypothetical protein n=1 Tax=Bacteroides sp. TaxID=29523 RepID=UPI0026056D3F|nr:hypothetical protein [Bacteroides sp.]MDD3039652.1 hypothetical protein [Bacteroides sp.]